MRTFAKSILSLTKDTVKSTNIKNMDKPEDYSEYFNEVGTVKKNPHEFGSKPYYEWSVRESHLVHLFIRLNSPLISNETKEFYLTAKRNLKAKMQSSVGGTVFND